MPPLDLGGDREVRVANCWETTKDVVWSCTSWEEVHGASNAQPRHQITTASFSYHKSICQLLQHIRRPPLQRRITSSIHGSYAHVEQIAVT